MYFFEMTAIGHDRNFDKMHTLFDVFVKYIVVTKQICEITKKIKKNSIKWQPSEREKSLKI